MSYLSDIVVDGLAKSVVASLNHLHSQARLGWGLRCTGQRALPAAGLPACLPPDLHSAHLLPSSSFPLPPAPLPQISAESLARGDVAPLLDVQLELVGADIAWTPEIGEAAAAGGASARSLLQGWVQSFFTIGSLVQRLDTGEGESCSVGWLAGALAGRAAGRAAEAARLAAQGRADTPRCSAHTPSQI